MKQERRFSDEELNLIKGTFKNNEELLKSLRKFILQLPLLERDEVLLRNQIKGGIFQVVKKCFLPEIEGDAPIMQTVDLWLTLNFGEKSPDIAFFHIQARGKLIEYFKEVFNDLEGKPYNRIDFKGMTDGKGKPEDIYIDLLTRNTIAMHVEQQLSQINILANEEKEIPETLAKKAEQNSSK
jgi:hypothetical protein